MEEVTIRISATVMITPVRPGMLVKVTYAGVCTEADISMEVRGENGALKLEGTKEHRMMPLGFVAGSHFSHSRLQALTVLLEWMGFSHLSLPSWCRSERTEERLPSAACWLSL